jgi:hypothetical protein
MRRNPIVFAFHRVLAFSRAHLHSSLKVSAILPISALLLSTLTGCVTSTTLDYARGGSLKEDAHGKDVVTKPHPAAYALVPFAAIADLPTVPLLFLITTPCYLGLVPYP